MQNHAIQSDQFKVLASEALQQAQQQFLTLAKQTLGAEQQESRHALEMKEQAIAHMVGPLSQKLEQLDVLTRRSETTLRENLQHLQNSQQQLTRETARLVQALRSPQTRGRWGEQMLRRTVEAAGLQAQVSFFEQVTISTDSTTQRPDMLINLPENRSIVVDAKAPLDAYLQALEAEDDATQKQHLQRHAQIVRGHVRELQKRNYPKHIPESADFTILFLPGEDIFRAALQHDLGLLDDALKMQVILASPFSLLAVLRAVDYSWRQQKLTENARAIADVGRDLLDRLNTFAGHLGGVEKALSHAVEKYNNSIRSFTSRVMPSVRKLADYQSQSVEKLEALEEIPHEPRGLAGPEDTTKSAA